MPSYEELVGGLGRAVAYRAERYLVRELISDAAATLISSGQQYQLYDIAMNGISLNVPADDPQWEEGGEITATLLIHGSPVYRGPVRVARVETLGKSRMRVGLQLMRGFIDLPEIRRQDEQAALTRALEDGPGPIREAVPAAYREVVERLVHFLQFYRRTLDQQEKRYRNINDDGQHAITSMTRQALNAVRPRWNELREAAAEAAAPTLADRDMRTATKHYTETLVTPLLLPAPSVRRAYEKPLSYPGDYQTMLFIYRNQMEGDSAYAQVMHKLSVEEPLAVGVRGRKDFLKRLQEREQRRFRDNNGPVDLFRVSSLGSGPAREVVEYVEENRRWTGHTHWTLIDQEEESLSLAYQSLFRQLALNNAPGSVRCVYVSFTQILNDPGTYLQKEQQHLLYCSGVFDYLGPRQGQKLLGVLLDHVAPGGLLAIGNGIGPNNHFWLTEFVLDWSLIFRDEQQMLDLAAKVGDQAESVEVVSEPTNAFHFLLIRKKR